MRTFAYGSNLDDADLAAWSEARGLPPLRLTEATRGYLPDRRLAFTHRSSVRGGGVLDVPKAPGHAVAGILFTVDAASPAVLDRKESEGHTYRRFDGVVLTDGGLAHSAFSYEVDPAHRKRHVVPAAGYLSVVRRAYARHGLPVRPLDDAAGGRESEGAVAHLFVYGTLMRGECRAHVLDAHGARFEGDAAGSGTLLDLGDHPGLVLEGTQLVDGELFRLAARDTLFRELDAIEEFLGFETLGSVYRRTILAVRAKDGRSIPAWVYVYEGDREGLPVLRTGSWRRKDRT